MSLLKWLDQLIGGEYTPGGDKIEKRIEDRGTSGSLGGTVEEYEVKYNKRTGEEISSELIRYERLDNR